MDEAFKIFVDRLKGGKVEKIDHSFAPDFIDVKEKDLSFPAGVEVRGEAYVTNEDLVLHLDIGTVGVMPCSICNNPVDVRVDVAGCYHVESLKKIKAGIFDMRDAIRESVLLECPAFAECNEGSCPKRKELGKFLKTSSSVESDVEVEGYHPFTDLTLE
ncbi:MAG: hypothetical protein K940chlam7_01525 [Chlamydiae bacterium]|nr:hypothetical protein [Chlamydiota bacterium]